MPDVTSARTPTPGLNGEAPSIVLFGMPAAGKSSLLGALAEAARTQQHLLNGCLADVPEGLTTLQHRLYEGQPRETREELVSYHVGFEPLASPAVDGKAGHVDFLLVDCDGRAANDLLYRRRSLHGNNGDGSLAQAVLEADTLILAIDASTCADDLEAHFAEFLRFLEELERSRGQRTAVGGLPVFLVLTKCDLLAHADDTPADWMEHIEEQKHQVGLRFHEFLARRANQGASSFGSIELHLWATAVKRPALVGSPARPREPYGVAELFRQCLEHSQRYRRRQRQSGKRLTWTIAGAAGIVMTLGLVSGALISHRVEPKSSALAAKVETLRLVEESKPPADRLRGALQRKLGELRDLKNDPGFDKLPPTDRQFVQDRIEEVEAYIDYRTKLRHVHVAEVQKEIELNLIETRLKDELAPPAKYAEAWRHTPAALLRTNLLKDIAGLRLALGDTEEWYRRRINQAEELRTFTRGKPSDAPSWEEWLGTVDRLVQQKFPHAETEELPGTNAVNYGVVLRTDRVSQLAQDWEPVKERLTRVRDLGYALGLAGKAPDGERQPLDIPGAVTLDQVRNHCQRLKTLYPDLPRQLASMELPDAIAMDLRRTARISYQHLVAVAQPMILARLQQASSDGKETPELWHGLRDWLDGAPELSDWRVLATALARVQNPQAEDPVQALRDFIQRDHFDIDIHALILEIPYDRKLRPQGPMTMFHGRGGSDARPELVFKLKDEEGRRDTQRRVTVYTFVREAGATLVYQPGDRFFATLPVKREGSTSERMLTWDRGRSDVYQFERIVRPPRLHLKDESSNQGESMEDIVVRISPESGLPRVPDLVPVVRLRKQ
jgi:hypothetical protein